MTKTCNYDGYIFYQIYLKAVMNVSQCIQLFVGHKTMKPLI